MEFGNSLPHDINISGSNNKGFIVRAGCCTSVFTDEKKMLEAIAEYIKDPAKAQKEYNESNSGPMNTNAMIDTSGSGLAIRTDSPHGHTENCDCQAEEPDRRR